MNNILKPGDILVFKAGNDPIGKSIAWITKSEVSHAAMVYQEDRIVEMGMNGIAVSKVTAVPGNSVYLLRRQPDVVRQPLIDRADIYINAKTRYDFPALVILAGLLIYREIRPTSELVTITDLIIRSACKKLDQLIQSLILKKHDKPMVCSQLVYQIYHDCGKDYRIKLKDGMLQKSDSIRLIDMFDDIPETPLTQAILADQILEDDDVLAQQLYEIMSKQQTDTEVLELADFAQLLHRGKEFLKLLEEFLKKAKSDIPVDALFVTPSDLLSHAKNLELIQTMELKRTKAL